MNRRPRGNDGDENTVAKRSRYPVPRFDVFRAAQDFLAAPRADELLDPYLIPDLVGIFRQYRGGEHSRVSQPVLETSVVDFSKFQSNSTTEGHIVNFTPNQAKPSICAGFIVAVKRSGETVEVQGHLGSSTCNVSLPIMPFERDLDPQWPLRVEIPGQRLRRGVTWEDAKNVYLEANANQLGEEVYQALEFFETIYLQLREHYLTYYVPRDTK